MMKTLVRTVVLATALVGVLAQGTTQAATPDKGTLSKTKRALSWEGGPFALSQPGLDSDCLGGSDDPTCDYYYLTVNLGDGANIEVSIKTARPCTADCLAQPAQGDDYDLFVYSADGVKVAEKATPSGNERLVFRHRARYTGKPYEIRVTPWAVAPGSTYEGAVTAKTLGLKG